MGFIEFFNLNILDKSKTVQVKNLLYLKPFPLYDFIYDLNLNIYEKDELLNIIRSFVDEDIDTIGLQGIALSKGAPVSFGPRSFVLGPLFKIYLDSKCRGCLVFIDDEGELVYEKVQFNNSFCHFINVMAEQVTTRFTPSEFKELANKGIVENDLSSKESLVDIIVETMRVYNDDRKNGFIEDPQLIQ